MCIRDSIFIINIGNDFLTLQLYRHKKTKYQSSKNFLDPPIRVGVTVHVSVPQVDGGKIDTRRILAPVMEVTEDMFF